MNFARDAIIMCRISSVKQNIGNSLSEQEAICKEYCRSKNFEVIQNKQAIESAFTKRRPKFNEILNLIQQVKVAPVALVLAESDRLARNFNHMSLLDELVQTGKVEIHFVKEQVVISSFSTADDLRTYRIFIAQAEYYSAKLSEATKKSLQTMRENGFYPGKAPIGYKNCRPSWCPWILPDEQAGKVQFLFDTYLQSEIGIKKLLEIAQSLPLYTTTGSLISLRTLIHMLRNSFYCGQMKSGGKLYRHGYERLVNEDVFAEVQKKLDRELGRVANKEMEVQVAA